jgi:hypothetical protein
MYQEHIGQEIGVHFPLNQLVREAVKQSGTVEFQRAGHEPVLESELLVSNEKSDDAARCG